LQGVTLGGYPAEVSNIHELRVVEFCLYNVPVIGTETLYFGHSYFLAGPCPGGGVGDLEKTQEEGWAKL